MQFLIFIYKHKYKNNYNENRSIMQPTIIRKIGTRVAEKSYFLCDILLRQFFSRYSCLQLFIVHLTVFEEKWIHSCPSTSY